ncbi:MAG: c-type cytochrome [Flavobacteriales bacterium]|nr:c-type cytochrome [Flavobacteriales bacterium]
MKLKAFTFLGVAGLFLTLLSFTNGANELASAGEEGWEVPDAAKNMKNPTSSSDKEGMAIGKSLYNKHCKSCHGSEGMGDGPKAGELDTDCGDFTMEEFQSQSDGSIFYKTREGRDDMPSFKKKITEEEDVWYIVNYLRTLK